MYSNIYYESLKVTTQSCKIIIETRLCHLRFDGISIFLLTGKVNCYFFRYYAHCPSLHGLSVHNHLVLPYLMNYGSQEQIDTYMPRMVSVEFIGCIGMSDPAAGR